MTRRPSRQDAQVVVNLISDADQADALLPLAADLVRRLGKPVINDPGKIQRTTRDSVAELLAGYPGLPDSEGHAREGRRRTFGRGAAGRHSVASRLSWPGRSGPMAATISRRSKIRPCSCGFLAQRPESDHYLIEYVDYRSDDGYFRKYRFIFVGDHILPYHLAIGNDWKVHHVSTDMANQAWMQQEEEAFLKDPTAVFNAGHYQALRAIQQRIGLEYFGIDCGLDRSGNLVVFEVNASMLVHDDNEDFPYKDAVRPRIKSAFDAMLLKMASGGVSGMASAGRV